MANKRSKYFGTIQYLTLFCLTSLVISGNALAQGVNFNSNSSRDVGSQNKTYFRKGKNLPAYDEKFVHYGFLLGINVSTFRPEPSFRFLNHIRNPESALPDTNPVYAIQPVPSIGFTTGFVFNFRLNQDLDFRILPTVAFYNRFVSFRTKDNVIRNYLNRFTFSYLEFPLLFKYKSQRRHNTRMYLVGGIKPGFEVGIRREEAGPDELRANSSDFCIDYGVGFDLYYPMFKFSPEIRFSHGFNDMRYPDVNKYSLSINRMQTFTTSLILNFE